MVFLVKEWVIVFWKLVVKLFIGKGVEFCLSF